MQHKQTKKKQPKCYKTSNLATNHISQNIENISTKQITASDLV